MSLEAGNLKFKFSSLYIAAETMDRFSSHF